MKIIQISFSLTSGGAERFVVDLCNKLASDNHNNVTLLTLLDDKKTGNSHYMKDLLPTVKYINTGGNRGYSCGNMFKILQIIRNEKPDVVHAHCGVMTLLFPAIFCKKTSYIHTIHSLAQRYSPGMIQKFLSRYLYGTGKITPVTISTTCHKSYYQYYGLSNDVCIDNGREALKTTIQFESVKNEISRLKQNKNVPIFIHIARHHPVKNHNRLFKTFERLREEGVDFLLLVIGDNYGELLEKYENDRQIVLLGQKNNIGDYMFLADFFVLSSDAEGLPITLLEALSMGVIPVCTPAGGIVDVIRDGENGYLANTIDDEDFYQAVRKALQENGKVLPNRLKEEFIKKYSMEKCSEKYYKLYEKVIRK